MQWHADIASVSREITGSTFMMHANAVISLEWPLITGPQGRLLVSVLVHRASAVRNPQITAEMWNRLWTLCYSPALHQREESVAQPITGWRRDRESSVDTGYPGSAGTPITLPELDVQEWVHSTHLLKTWLTNTYRKQDLKLTVWRSMCRWKHMWATNSERFSLAITTSLNTSPYY